MRTPTPPDVRIMRRVVVDSGGCWVYTGGLTCHGYGRVGIGSLTDGTRRGALAHRVLYEIRVGPVPAGWDLDHLCRKPACVNPEHLEPVTHRENVMRGRSPIARNPEKTHCPHGHEYAGRNLGYDNGARICRTCRAAQQQRIRDARKKETAA